MTDQTTDSAMRNCRKWNQAGFTLVEALVVLAMVSLVFGTIYDVFATLNRSYTSENVKANLQQTGRIALEFMAQDIRLAGLDPLGTATAGIVEIAADHIRFTADLNYDGDTGDPSEDITYRFTGHEITQKDETTTEETLLDNVQAASFTGLDANDAPTGDTAEVRSVEISVTLERPAGPGRNISRTYTTRVRCRNL
jgi:type IV pilus assembly protein PilW